MSQRYARVSRLPPVDKSQWLNVRGFYKLVVKPWYLEICHGGKIQQTVQIKALFPLALFVYVSLHAPRVLVGGHSTGPQLLQVRERKVGCTSLLKVEIYAWDQRMTGVCISVHLPHLSPPFFLIAPFGISYLRQIQLPIQKYIQRNWKGLRWRIICFPLGQHSPSLCFTALEQGPFAGWEGREFEGSTAK